MLQQERDKQNTDGQVTRLMNHPFLPLLSNCSDYRSYKLHEPYKKSIHARQNHTELPVFLPEEYNLIGWMSRGLNYSSGYNRLVFQSQKFRIFGGDLFVH